MAADGSIIIETTIDDKQAQQGLNRLNKKIQTLNDQIYIKQKQKMPLVEQSKELGAQLDAAKAKLASLQSTSYGGVGKAEIQEQKERVRLLQSEWNKVQGQVERYDDAIKKAGIELDLSKERAGAIQSELATGAGNGEKLANSMNQARKQASRFADNIGRAIGTSLLFSFAFQAVTAFTEWFGKVIKVNNEAAEAVGRFKGALLTMVQPLLNVIIPAFATFLNILTSIINSITKVIAALFGMTADQAAESAENLYNETEAIEGVGAAADKAAGSLAGFDEINTIQTEPAGGGGGADTSEAIEPIFKYGEGIATRLKEIADLVLLIGAGFALWKIGSALPGILGKILTTLGLIMIAIAGVLLFWNGLTDAWENGVDWVNLIEVIGGLAAAVFALYSLFGPVAAGITLVVGGLAMLVTGFKDAFENGWTLENTLLSIAGILATGLGISLLTGSWIPLLIAAIASVLLAFTNATGHGEELLAGLKTAFEGFVDFFTGIFTGDIEKAIDGIGKIFDGLKTIVFAVISGIEDTFNAFLDWLDEKTGGKLTAIIELIKTLFTGVFETIRLTIDNLAAAIEEIFTGIVEFISGVFSLDFDRALDGIIKIVDGFLGCLLTPILSVLNLIIDAINTVISGLNKISFNFPSWVPGVGGKKFGINISKFPKITIPALAQGAVIPPNREFMAVLGDQTRGNNIEAPEGLIRRIVREESGGMTIELLQQILAAIQAGQVIKVNETVLGRTSAKAINKLTLSSGKSVLLY